MRAYNDDGSLTADGQAELRLVDVAVRHQLDLLVERGFNIIESSQLVLDALTDSVLMKKFALQDEDYKRRKAEYEANCVRVELMWLRPLAHQQKVPAIQTLRGLSEAPDGYSMGLVKAKEHVDALFREEKTIVLLDRRKVEEMRESFDSFFGWDFVKDSETPAA